LHVFDFGDPSAQLFQGGIGLSLDLLSEEVPTALEGPGPTSAVRKGGTTSRRTLAAQPSFQRGQTNLEVLGNLSLRLFAGFNVGQHSLS
jgi:hypothetical protein